MRSWLRAGSQRPFWELHPCSPRQGKTGVTGVKVDLDAAVQGHSGLNTELIDLGELTLPGWNGIGKSQEDDFARVVLAKLRNLQVDGIDISVH
ncbi:MAG: hypothetical protein GY809_14810 [Planctomycetes bacterium]|nr:hypothetical protein [Planctomycetota bacterium]